MRENETSWHQNVSVSRRSLIIIGGVHLVSQGQDNFLGIFLISAGLFGALLALTVEVQTCDI
jgi:hypothetical protein